jgi:DNA-binding response OmpR family regulator
MSKIIIIDDDKRLCEKLEKYLLDFSFDLVSYNEPLPGIEAIRNNQYSVLILDGMLPGMDGFEVCKKVREFSQIPIIFLTGRVEEADKILGLEYGADDYVTKPFSPRELVARIKSQLRRGGHVPTSASTTSEDGLELNLGSYTAKYQGELIKLTATEFEILNYLVQHKGMVRSREEIMQGLHGDTWEAFDRSLDIAVSRIRKKLKEISNGKEFIKTVRLKGYIFATES